MFACKQYGIVPSFINIASLTHPLNITKMLTSIPNTAVCPSCRQSRLPVTERFPLFFYPPPVYPSLPQLAAVSLPPPSRECLSRRHRSVSSAVIKTTGRPASASKYEVCVVRAGSWFTFHHTLFSPSLTYSPHRYRYSDRSVLAARQDSLPHHALTSPSLTQLPYLQRQDCSCCQAGLNSPPHFNLPSWFDPL
jgi:hypothetical protein